MNLRWGDYFSTLQFRTFWQERQSQKDASACVILGLGFDPRCLAALEELAAVTPTSDKLGYVALDLKTPVDGLPRSEALEKLHEQNRLRLERLAGIPCVGRGDLSLQDADGHPSGGRIALSLVNGLLDAIASHRDVIVDISGMPRSVFFPLISFLCARTDQGRIRNLHVAVTEDPLIDAEIRGSEFGDADFLHTFRPQGSKKMVWLPVVQHGEQERIRKIHNQIRDECIEICPILPFPAKNLRTADEILIELSDTLFEDFLVSPGNLLFCDERTPFDIYRKVVQLHDYHVEKLGRLVGEVTSVVSPLASKLLSLGLLLAAIDRHLPVSYVEAGMYEIDADRFYELAARQHDPLEVWVAGEPYSLSADFSK
jgi:hypothetical protein